MKINKNIYLPLLMIVLIVLSSCGQVKKAEPIVTESDYKIGVNSLTGNVNPLYAQDEGDRAVIDKIFGKIRTMSPSNKPINNFGSISYEYVADDKVKYTVSIEDDLRFSDGSYVTIDDVIFVYYLLADPSYDGVYSQWHNNDIEGLREYYDDTKENQSSETRVSKEYKVTEPSETKSSDDNINYDITEEKNEGGYQVTEISGIKRVNDYTCTVLYNSADINAGEELNVYIMQKSFYAGEYVRGNAEVIEKISDKAMGCGKYELVKADGNEAELKANSYSKQKAEYEKISFVKLETDDLVDAVCNGDINQVSVVAKNENMQKITNSGIGYTSEKAKHYYSMFFSEKLDTNLRKALMCLGDDNSVSDEIYGSYYTRLFLPVSSRNDEYPTDVISPEYPKNDFELYYSLTVADSLSLNAGIFKNIGQDEKKYFDAYIEELKKNNIDVNLIEYSSEERLSEGALNGDIDFWLEKVDDNGTLDKYDYYHSAGNKNYTGIVNSELDMATLSLHNAIAFANKRQALLSVMEIAMDLAIELPLYQQQIVTLIKK